MNQQEKRDDMKSLEHLTINESMNNKWNLPFKTFDFSKMGGFPKTFIDFIGK